MFFLKKVIFILLCSSMQLFGQDRPIAISLGTVCPVAFVLREKNIRTVAYPFDWVVVPFYGLYRTLEHDFDNFILKKNLIVQIGPNFDGVVDTDTYFVFFHDFPILNDVSEQEDTVKTGKIIENFLDFYDDINNKYQRRISRFREALSSSEKVILIRYLATKEEAILLRDLIRSKYPLLDFTLVIITDNLEHKNWNEFQIENYYIPPANVWNCQSAEWLNVFYDTKLLSD